MCLQLLYITYANVAASYCIYVAIYLSCCIVCYACNFTCCYNHVAIDDVTEPMAKKRKAESKYIAMKL